MEENTASELSAQPIKPMKSVYKMIVMRGMVIFPGQTFHFDLGREKSRTALERAVELNEDIFLVAQKHDSMANPAPKDIYRVGTVARIKQVLKMPNDATRVLVTGIRRMEIDSYVSILPAFEVTLKEFETEPSDESMMEAVCRVVGEQLSAYKKLDRSYNDMIVSPVGSDKFIAEVSQSIYKTVEQRQALLQLKSDYAMMEDIYARLVAECDMKTLEKKIAGKVRANIDKSQHEYYVREQIKALHDELGDGADELDEYEQRAEDKQLPEHAMEKVRRELARLDKMNPTSPEAGVSRTYLECILDLPWTETGRDNKDLDKATAILDADHYGLEKVKERIVEYLAVHQLTQNLRGSILCFVGPPGVGKTSIVASIARAVNRKLVSMSLGGVRDEAEIRGHRRTYIGALPGRILSGMRQAGVINPVFLLDEIDKMTSDFRGDPASALLEVLDPNQNDHFKDHYLDMEYDLSNVMFVTTANSVDTIPAPLLDRMEVIELTGYTFEEKLQIAKRFLLPKQQKQNGLEKVSIDVSDDVLMKIIVGYTRESGVRNLERSIEQVIRKLAVQQVKNKKKIKQFTVTESDLTEYLGVVKYTDDDVNKIDDAGVVTGLAWTSVGGVTLNVEAAVIGNGKGEILLTGSLGDVMKESARTALSLVRSRAEQYGIAAEKFTACDLHIHVPEGATPKDGPSAGITMATAILSAMTGRKVRSDVAMTGEITLRGRVLAIGGLKEKSLAAYRIGIKTLIIPEENRKDVHDLPAEVTDNIRFLYASNIDEVFENAFI